jgi:hypothetical protein
MFGFFSSQRQEQMSVSILVIRGFNKMSNNEKILKNNHVLIIILSTVLAILISGLSGVCIPHNALSKAL